MSKCSVLKSPHKKRKTEDELPLNVTQTITKDESCLQGTTVEDMVRELGTRLGVLQESIEHLLEIIYHDEQGSDSEECQ